LCNLTVDWHTFAPAHLQLLLIAKGELSQYQRESKASNLELLEDLWDNEDIDLEHRDYDKGYLLTSFHLVFLLIFPAGVLTEKCM
jgi:hypothetical protein